MYTWSVYFYWGEGRVGGTKAQFCYWGGSAAMADSAQGEWEREHMGKYLIIIFSESFFQLNEIVTIGKVYW